MHNKTYTQCEFQSKTKGWCFLSAKPLCIMKLTTQILCILIFSLLSCKSNYEREEETSNKSTSEPVIDNDTTEMLEEPIQDDVAPS